VKHVLCGKDGADKEVAQIIYTPVSKCKNDKIKERKKKKSRFL
jgi:hypothetical protein